MFCELFREFFYPGCARLAKGDLYLILTYLYLLATSQEQSKKCHQSSEKEVRVGVNKSELIDVLAQETGFQRGVAEFVVKEVFSAMTESLAQGEGVELRGFGSFTVREYKSYKGRNPKSGEQIHVAPKKLPFFKVGKELRERVIDKVGAG
jgi:integration host factor subunit beta